jgi:mannose-6-phosphate isomerase-like protein (cupin superfamily)
LRRSAAGRLTGLAHEDAHGKIVLELTTFDVSARRSNGNTDSEAQAMAHDTSVQKVSSQTAPLGAMGQKYLACGIRMGMRLWVENEPFADKPVTERDYETIGFVIGGRAELDLEGQRIILEPGDSWVVPKGARHRYTVPEAFTAVEVTSPPAQVHGRDEAQLLE